MVKFMLGISYHNEKKSCWLYKFSTKPKGLVQAIHRLKESRMREKGGENKIKCDLS